MNVHGFADWLGRRSPRLYRMARPPWLRLMRSLGRPGYWESRRHLSYYDEVARMAREHAGTGRTVIDVGASETEVLERLEWFERRVALDVRYVMPRRGIETVVGDFEDYAPGAPFDLVLCLQVLEHLPEPAPFARKLLRTGRRVIVTIPYRWPEGTSPHHLQDPIDEAKLRRWTGRDPVEISVVDDGRERLVAVYRGLAG